MDLKGAIREATVLRKNKLLDGALVSGLVLLVGGCSATAEMESMRATLDDVKSVAQQALREAQQASSTAAGADQKAGDALRAAEEANQCCQTNSEKIDRMFKKAMKK